LEVSLEVGHSLTDTIEGVFQVADAEVAGVAEDPPHQTGDVIVIYMESPTTPSGIRATAGTHLSLGIPDRGIGLRGQSELLLELVGSLSSEDCFPVFLVVLSAGRLDLL
jgi:hypothetical protein